MRFRDRYEAGRLLAEELAFLRDRENVIVLGVPRGGVVVGYEIARALAAPLDVYITRKIGAPYNPELAIGAVASDGNVVLDEGLLRRLGISQEYVEEETARQQTEIERRLAEYRGDRPPLELKDRTVILTDDGVATGATILATIQAIKAQEPEELILAIPVGPPDTIAHLGKEVDKVICLSTPHLFWAVGAFYLDFSQTTDEEVKSLLEESREQGQ
ncbi:MAG: phosphoribosyltransferase [Anaerolineae bacterium]